MATGGRKNSRRRGS